MPRPNSSTKLAHAFLALMRNASAADKAALGAALEGYADTYPRSFRSLKQVQGPLGDMLSIALETCEVRR